MYENVESQLTCTAMAGRPYPKISIAFGSTNVRTPAVITQDVSKVTIRIALSEQLEKYFIEKTFKQINFALDGVTQTNSNTYALRKISLHGGSEMELCVEKQFFDTTYYCQPRTRKILKHLKAVVTTFLFSSIVLPLMLHRKRLINSVTKLARHTTMDKLRCISCVQQDHGIFHFHIF